MKALEFFLSVLRGLGKAVTTDTEVCMLALGGLLVGRKGIGASLFALVAARRADQYASVWVTQTNRLAQEISLLGTGKR